MTKLSTLWVAHVQKLKALDGKNQKLRALSAVVENSFDNLFRFLDCSEFQTLVIFVEIKKLSDSDRIYYSKN